MEQTPRRAQNQKTIFVVDDDPSIRRCVGDLFAAAGYYILTSESGTEALGLSRGYKDEIDLLLSDFEMPGMSGVELATAMTADRPRLKVLLMSGFTGGMLVLNEGWHFLAKPFIPSQLRALVAGMISTEARSRYSE